jgi:hypothetical protein
MAPRPNAWAASIERPGASTEARFGRLRLGNATGSELLDLPLAIDLQYWSGNGFATNAADSCTTQSGSRPTRARSNRSR